MRGDLIDKVILRFKETYYKIIIKIKYGSQQLFHDFCTKSPKNLLACFSRSSAQLNFPPESSARFTELDLDYLPRLDLGFCRKGLRCVSIICQDWISAFVETTPNTFRLCANPETPSRILSEMTLSTIQGSSSDCPTSFLYFVYYIEGKL
jgi:hypothetical protein